MKVKLVTKTSEASTLSFRRNFAISKEVAHCFQLDIRKKIFRIFSTFEKHPTPAVTLLIYSTKQLFTEIRSLKKNSIVKHFLKYLFCSNCE